MSCQKEIKILHLIDSGGLYGAERMLLTLVSAQISSGLDPLILSVGEYGVQEKAIEYEAKRLGLPVKSWRMRPGLNLLGAVKIISWARSEGFKLIHSHGYKFNVLIGMLPFQFRKIAFVSTLHGYINSPAFSKSWLYEMLDRVALRFAQRIVLVSHAMKDQVPRSLLVSPKLSIVPNGLNSEDYKENSQDLIANNVLSFLESHNPLILGVGRLSKEKGFDTLIESFVRVKEVYLNAGLLIVGEGPFRLELEKVIQDYNLRSDVLMPGYVDCVSGIMKQSHVLCIPSRTEGLPITLLEAMLMGVPLVTSDVGEIPLVLGDGKGGIVLKNIDISGLADGLINCLSDERRSSEAVAWSKERARIEYSSETMEKRYREIYDQVLA